MYTNTTPVYCSMQMRKTYRQMKAPISTNLQPLNLEKVSRETLEKKYFELLEIQHQLREYQHQLEEVLFLPF